MQPESQDQFAVNRSWTGADVVALVSALIVPDVGRNVGVVLEVIVSTVLLGDNGTRTGARRSSGG